MTKCVRDIVIIDDKINSNMNYQLALRHAIMLASNVGRGIALGNMAELPP